MSKHKIFDSSDSESDGDLPINKEYAKIYDTFREKEEFQKLKDKYGKDEGSSSDSESSEDEVPPDFTPEMEKDFLRTLSCLKSRNPKIYDPNIRFFKETPIETAKVEKEKKEKPMNIMAYEHKMFLEKGGVLSDEEDGGTGPNEESSSYWQEQKQLKESFKQNLVNSDDSDDDETFLKKNEKSEIVKKAEEDYVAWLKDQKDIKETPDLAEIKDLKKHWNDPNLDEGESYLKDYILNKRYLDDEENDPEDTENLSEDELELEEQSKFEQKYNFRFEEPDAHEIKRYPRQMNDLMRRKDDKRKQQRDQYKDRKEQEKVQKKEELKKLKAMKRKEIMEKIEKLKAVTGNEKLGLLDADLEGDFNPEEYDRRMNEMFTDDYYNEGDEAVKPQFEFDEEIDDNENWDQWQGDDVDEDNPEIGPDNFEELNQETHETQEYQDKIDNSPQKGKKKRKSKFAEAVSSKKPVFEPQGENSVRSLQKYFDEYYKLDYEDIIGGMPVRFRYREVAPNDFGLSTEEILFSKDKELNHWCSVKKSSQYRSNEEEKYDIQAFKKKAENVNLKKKVLQSYYASDDTKTNPSTSQDKNSEVKKPNNEGNSKKKWKKHDGQHKNKQTNSNNVEMSDERLKAYGINPKKYKNKLKYKNKQM